MQFDSLLHTHCTTDEAALGGAVELEPSISSTLPELSDQLNHMEPEFAGGLMSDLIFKLTVNQLCSVIRSHGIDSESTTMLQMLELLVIAGEIPLHDFMERLQNLFPDIFARIDRTLVQKLTTIIVD